MDSKCILNKLTDRTKTWVLNLNHICFVFICVYIYIYIYIYIYVRAGCNDTRIRIERFSTRLKVQYALQTDRFVGIILLLREVDLTPRIWNNTAMFIWIQQSGKQGRMVSKYLEVLRMLKDILMRVFLPGTRGWRGWAHTSDQHWRWAGVTDEDRQT